MTGIHHRHWSGDPDRPALALHCMMGSGSYWGPIAERLDGRVDLRAFDMPSHGRSAAWAPDGVDFHTTVTRIAAGLIDRPMDLIGHSMGATVALRIAVGAPQAIRSLTLIEPVLFAAIAPVPAQAAEHAALVDLLAQGRRADAVRLFLDRWGGPGGLDAMPDAVRPALERQIELIVETGPTLSQDSANILREGGLEAIDAPVMLIAGSGSPPHMADILTALADRLPDVGRAVVPGAAHMLPLTHPDQVAGLIGANLDRA